MYYAFVLAQFGQDNRRYIVAQLVADRILAERVVGMAVAPMGIRWASEEGRAVAVLEFEMSQAGHRNLRQVG